MWVQPRLVILAADSAFPALLLLLKSVLKSTNMLSRNGLSAAKIF